jgi:hypothetical protein
MILLDIPSWFFVGIISVAGTVIASLVLAIIWFVRRTIRVVDRNTSAIEELNVTMLHMSNNFEKYQATNDGKLDNVTEVARKAERNFIEIEGDVSTIKVDVAKIDMRVGNLEKDHDFFTRGSKHK